jgi:hypothetical protein
MPFAQLGTRAPMNSLEIQPHPERGTGWVLIRRSYSARLQGPLRHARRATGLLEMPVSVLRGSLHMLRRRPPL